MEKNIEKFLKDNNLSNWKTPTLNFLRETLYKIQDINEAEQALNDYLDTVPEKLKKYLNSRKRGILLHTLTLGARVTAGLTRPNGEVDQVWNQTAESAHMVLTRRFKSIAMATGKPSLAAILRGIAAYFREVESAVLQARLGEGDWLLKPEYKHLSVDKHEYNRRVIEVSEVTRKDLWLKYAAGALGNVLGVSQNEWSYKVTAPQDDAEDRFEMSSSSSSSSSSIPHLARSSLSSLIPSERSVALSGASLPLQNKNRDALWWESESQFMSILGNQVVEKLVETRKCAGGRDHAVNLVYAAQARLARGVQEDVRNGMYGVPSARGGSHRHTCTVTVDQGCEKWSCDCMMKQSSLCSHRLAVWLAQVIKKRWSIDRLGYNVALLTSVIPIQNMQRTARTTYRAENRKSKAIGQFGKKCDRPSDDCK